MRTPFSAADLFGAQSAYAQGQSNVVFRLAQTAKALRTARADKRPAERRRWERAAVRSVNAALEVKNARDAASERTASMLATLAKQVDLQTPASQSYAIVGCRIGCPFAAATK